MTGLILTFAIAGMISGHTATLAWEFQSNERDAKNASLVVARIVMPKYFCRCRRDNAAGKLPDGAK